MVIHMKFLCDSKYLIFPASHHAQNKRLFFHISDTLVLDVVVALDYVTPDYEFYLDIERFMWKEITLSCDSEMTIEIRKSDTFVRKEDAYVGKYRPLAHFTSKRGWLNDPNGLVFYQGKYFMFYQHNPVASTWENMHWGCAVSDDLVHWIEKEIALFPDENGTMFSGSAIIDYDNRTGLKENDNDVILLYYTAAGNTSETSKNKPFTQRLAYSIDGGNTFRKYQFKPMLEQVTEGNRDPKIIYLKETNQYIMALYLSGHDFALYCSENLLDWTLLQQLELPGDDECPDFYPLPVDERNDTCKWVFSAASDYYYIGSFDGEKFLPETPVQRLNYGNCSYAAQSWSDAPDHRRIRTSFANIVVPSMPFGSCMNLPQEMTLQTIHDKLQLCAQPVKEVENLYLDTITFSDICINSQTPFRHKPKGRCLDITLNISDTSFVLSLFGLCIEYDSKLHTLKCLDCEAPVSGENGSLKLRLILDTIYTEIYVGYGNVFMGMSHIADPNLNTLTLTGSLAQIENLTISRLDAFWHEPKPTVLFSETDSDKKD